MFEEFCQGRLVADDIQPYVKENFCTHTLKICPYWFLPNVCNWVEWEMVDFGGRNFLKAGDGDLLTAYTNMLGDALPFPIPFKHVEDEVDLVFHELHLGK